MKAMRAHQFGGPEQLRFEDAPDPQVQAGQVQIRVRAGGRQGLREARADALGTLISVGGDTAAVRQMQQRPSAAAPTNPPATAVFV